MSNSNKVFNDIRDQIQDLINASISANLATAGTVTRLEAGEGIKNSPTIITQEGTISLDADLNNIDGVSIDTNNLAADQILAWNGTSWINKAFPGLSGTSFRFVDLIDVDIPNGLINNKNKLIAINSLGTSVVALTNDYINSVQGLAGIKRFNINDNTISLEFDPSSITTENTINNTDHLVYYRTGEGAKKTTLQNIDLSLFNDDLSLLTNNNVTAGNAITITDTGLSTIIGVCTLSLEVNFNAGVCGVLPIEYGGTSGTTSLSARDYLGLTYNRDILPVSGPSFRNLMYGDNISLLPSSFGLSLVTGGNGYTNGDNIILINPDTSAQIDLGISFSTGTGGTITGPLFKSLSIRNIDLLDKTTDYEVYDGSASGASFRLIPDPFYLLFGGSTRDTSIGLRDREGLLEVKSSHTGLGSSWRTIFPLALDGLSDVTVANPEDNQILIYEGTSFVNAGITGNSNYDVAFTKTGLSAIVSISAKPGTITLESIEGGVSLAAFQTLLGISSNIQNQLDDKIGVSPNFTSPASGDLIYYYDNDWNVLRNDGASGKKILGVSIDGDVPSYNYLYDFTSATSSGNWFNDGFVFVKEDEEAYRTPLSTFLEDNLCDATGGIEVDSITKKLKLSIDNLEVNTGSQNPNDLLLIYENNSTLHKKITRDNFLISVVSDGISVVNNKIVLDSDGVSAIKLRNYTDGASILSGASPTNFPFSLASVGSSLVYSNGTSWYYVSLGDVVTA